MSDDTRDRLVALEVVVRQQGDTLDAMNDKVSEMHDLLMRARGAEWLALGMMALVGFVAAKFTVATSWLVK